MKTNEELRLYFGEKTSSVYDMYWSTTETDEDKVRETVDDYFFKKYGVHPEHIVKDGQYWKAGPVPERTDDDGAD